MRKIPLLPPAPSDWAGKPSIVLGMTHNIIQTSNFEPAGRAFHAFCRNKTGIINLKQAHRALEEREEKKSDSDWKLAEDVDTDDYYAVLQLKDIGTVASPSDITRHYRKLCFLYHPDKNTDEDATEMFKYIQTAYDTLGDPIKKKTYDSTLPFDDDIPSSTLKPNENFFSKFRPVFERNGLFSVVQPCPSIGDEHSLWSEVDSFYDFWYSFHSWREFKVEGMFDIAEADCREERRWMEKENKRLDASERKREISRIRLLVDRAYTLDPRVIVHKAAIKKEKQEKKRAKMLEKEQQRMITQKKLDDITQQKEITLKLKQDAVIAEKKAEKEKRAKLKSLRYNFRVICRNLELDTNDIELLCKDASNVADFEVLIQDIQSHTDDKQQYQAIFALTLDKVLQKNATISIEQKQKAAHKEKKESPWTSNELSLLAKAVIKFPPGSTDRWNCIADSLGTRTAKEVIAKTKELRSTTTTINSDDAFQQWDNKLTKRKEELVDKMVSVDAAKGRTTQDFSTIELWDMDQQKALENALKTVPASPNRWDLIAELVPGKTKKDCVRRFKEIRAKLIKK